MGFSRIDIGEKILLSVTWTCYKIWQIKQEFCFYLAVVAVAVALLFYVHGKHLRSCQDGQLA